MEVEHDRDRQDMVATSEFDERLACLGLDVGGVDDGESPQRQSFPGDELKELEGLVRHRLVVLVV
jgi:hypothetical protein